MKMDLFTYRGNLTSDEVSQYSRQLVLPEFALKGQVQLKNTSFLVVGAGGLGCTAAIHLAGSGAGKITIVDHDRIECSNLHRQIMYSTKDIGRFKAEVLAERCNNLNPLAACKPVAHCILLTTTNVEEFVKTHDVVLDCTDNVYARYLLNDACVLAGKPLVSASALKFDGQLSVYNWKGSLCRRCLFPDPHRLQTQSCDDNGVMGPVPGIMGALQALEAVKLASGMDVSFGGVQLHFDALTGTFYRIKLRSRNPSCPVCGENPSIISLNEELLGPNTCLMRQPEIPADQTLTDVDRISVVQYNDMLQIGKDHLLIDVRLPVELEICGFRDCLNIPMEKLMDLNRSDEIREQILSRKGDSQTSRVVALCRRGNDSQIAVHLLRKILNGLSMDIKDIKGGLYSWHREIDKTFPIY